MARPTAVLRLSMRRHIVFTPNANCRSSFDYLQCVRCGFPILPDALVLAELLLLAVTKTLEKNNPSRKTMSQL